LRLLFLSHRATHFRQPTPELRCLGFTADLLKLSVQKGGWLYSDGLVVDPVIRSLTHMLE